MIHRHGYGKSRNKLCIMHYALCILLWVIFVSCRSSKKVRSSTVDIRVMSAVHLHWEYLSTPVDTVTFNLPTPNQRLTTND